MSTAQVEASWGVYINATAYMGRPIPKSSLTWAKPVGKDKWQKCGVVVWDNETERLEVFSAAHMLKLLEHLRTTDRWKAEGILIVRQPIHFPFFDDKKSPNNQISQAEEQLETQAAPSKLKKTVEEGFCLKNEAAERFFELLQTNESLLHQMAEAEENRRTEFRDRLFSLLIQGIRSVEAKRMDLSARPVVWVQDDSIPTLTCGRPPNRGTVQLTEDNLFWRGCIERPDCFKHWSLPFIELEPALAWVEQKLVKAEQEVPLKPEENGRKSIRLNWRLKNA